MKGEFLTLFEASKALITYIEKKYVFDTASAGGCSGMDYHLSDKFYDLIVNARKVINDIENGPEDSDTDGEASLRLLEAAKALTIHIEKERAFDKVNDMGPVGVETYQSDEFIKVIQQTNKAVEGAESELKATET